MQSKYSINQSKKQNPPLLKLPNFQEDYLHQNLISSKDNYCATFISNDNQSLLVSSGMRASSSKIDESSNKRQKRLNSDFILNQKEKQKKLRFNHRQNQPYPIETLNLQSQLQNNHYSNQIAQNSRNIEKNHYCSQSRQQIDKLKEQIDKNFHKIQQLQALIKICFAKNVNLQNSLNQKDKQLLLIHAKIQENQKMTKKNEQVLIKQSVSKNFQIEEFKTNFNKLSQKVSEKNKQINEIVELQKRILEQKISKVSIFCEQNIQTLIQMIEEVAKAQNKFVKQQKSAYQYEKQNTTNSCNIDFTMSSKQPLKNVNFNDLSSGKSHFYSTRTKSNSYHQNYGQKKKNQSKSKISYYLSKSNFNDTTTVGDMDLNQLSRIA